MADGCVMDDELPFAGATQCVCRCKGGAPGGRRGTKTGADETDAVLCGGGSWLVGEDSEDIAGADGVPWGEGFFTATGKLRDWTRVMVECCARGRNEG